MSRGINIVLPETTIRTIDRMAKPGQRSRFIDQAVQHFVANRSVEAIRARCRSGSGSGSRDYRGLVCGGPNLMATARIIRTTTKTSDPRRGEIYLTALDPTPGRKIQKTRPALISNRVSGTTIVAPITSTVRFPLNPVHVLLAADRNTGLTVTSVALPNQIRAVDRIRLVRRLGSVNRETLERVDEAIGISLGLIPL